MSGSMTHMPINHVATNPVCPPATIEKYLSQNNVGLRSRGPFGEQGASGSGAGHEDDLLRTSAIGPEDDSRDESESGLRRHPLAHVWTLGPMLLLRPHGCLCLCAAWSLLPKMFLQPHGSTALGNTWPLALMRILLQAVRVCGRSPWANTWLILMRQFQRADLLWLNLVCYPHQDRVQCRICSLESLFQEHLHL